MSTLSNFLNTAQLGTDIATDLIGDIAEKGKDVDTIDGIDNVINAFVRELVTPFSYLARWVYDAEGLKIIDEDYGNVAYLQLSEPRTETWISNMLVHINDVARGQARLTLQTIDYTLTPETNTIQFKIAFKILQNPKVYNLILNPLNGTLQTSLVVEN